MRAFIFSLDAFIAFTLALVAIYSLIFFSSVPSSYYYLLTQGHFLSRDVLMALSTTECTDDYGICAASGSVLDNIAFQKNQTFQQNLIMNTVGGMVPDQFGYRVEISSDNGNTFSHIYDTADNADDPHAKRSSKLTVSSQVVAFGYSGKVHKLNESPYNYLSCNGGGIIDEDRNLIYSGGMSGWGIITCGILELTGAGGETESISIGNIHPDNIFGGEIVPSSDVKIVKFLVYI
ncbi:hypothetical protein JXA56_02260 [Candidatus Micrarchaeota archaeon]|nr:hypothetical protein [Candidatus Micrarchaeota archaeon]